MGPETSSFPFPILPLEPPRSVYAAFEVFPRPKGVSTHIAAVLQALALHHAPVWLLCCGTGGMPAFQREGPIVIWRYMEAEANMLRRARGKPGHPHSATGGKYGSGD